MEIHLETLPGKETTTSDPFLRKSMQNSRSSKIMKRKISSCHFLKIKPSSVLKPSMVLLSKSKKILNNDHRRSESMSHSPSRNKSKSSKLIKPDYTTLSSPLYLRKTLQEKEKNFKGLKEEIKTESKKSLKFKNFNFDPVVQSMNIKTESSDQTVLEKHLSEARKKKIRKQAEEKKKKTD